MWVSKDFQRKYSSGNIREDAKLDRSSKKEKWDTAGVILTIKWIYYITCVQIFYNFTHAFGRRPVSFSLWGHSGVSMSNTSLDI